MDTVQITALIGAVASLLCTLVVGALTFFLKKTLSSLEKADEKNAAKIAEVEDKFSKKHKTLIDQMLKYPMGKNDDAPDALQMAVALALSVKVGRKVDYKSVLGRAVKFRRGAY